MTSDLQITNPQVTVEIDRDKASALGVSAQQIENALYNAYGPRQVSTIYTPTNQYWVIMELQPEVPDAIASVLSLLYVRSASGNAGAAQRGGDAAATASDRSRSTISASCPR